MPRTSLGRRAAAALLATLVVAGPACSPSEARSTAGSADRAPALAQGGVGLDSARLARAHARAAELPKLRSLLVQWRGGLVLERYYHGASAARPANIKSASKSVLSALVGVAVARGRLPGTEARLDALLPAQTRGLDERARAVTVEDLLTMRSGLESTSIQNYGAWVSSRNWVRYALTRPVVAPAGHEGGPMIYSTGNTHLLSAALTRATGQSTYAFYAQALARPLGITPRAWATDPQGVYFGGNEMRLTPREMVRFGELYLNRGRAPEGTPAAGRQLVPAAWVDSSWVPRTRSSFSNEDYGYGWFLRTMRGARGPHRVAYAWGYGGQFIFVVPSLALVAVTTSDPDAPARDRGHLDAIRRLVEEEVIPAVGG